MTASRLAADTWAMAATHGTAPVVYELAACDCPVGHSAHVVAAHRPVDERYVTSTVCDLVALPGTFGLAVWTATSQPAGAQMLLVIARGDAVVLVGPVDGTPRVLEAMAGRLYVACLAALTPTPADDPLVVELASIASKGE